MILELIETKEILDFEKENNLELVIKERPRYYTTKYKLEPYYAYFKDYSLLEGSMIIGEIGNGNSVNAAIVDYAKRIECKTIVCDLYDNRIEILCSKLIHTKFIDEK